MNGYNGTDEQREGEMYVSLWMFTVVSSEESIYLYIYKSIYIYVDEYVYVYLYIGTYKVSRFRH